jgi:cytochrome c biogenesis protein CcmG/thiol:disulfide interchange protein DsbE
MAEVTERDDEVVEESGGHQVIWTVGVLAVLLALFIGVLATRGPSGEHVAKSPLIGKVAPSVGGKTIDGDEFDLASLRGRWAVVNFFATWCIPCIQEHPELAKFQAEHAHAGDASLVSVLYDDEVEKARDAFARLGGSWPVVVDDDGSTGVDYGVARVPETFLISPNGVVVERIQEGTTAAELDALIQAYEKAAS